MERKIRTIRNKINVLMFKCQFDITIIGGTFVNLFLVLMARVMPIFAKNKKSFD